MQDFRKPLRMWALITPEFQEMPQAGIDLFKTRREARYFKAPCDRIVPVIVKRRKP